MGDWVYWLSWSVAFALGAVSVYLVWWALFFDRPNGRRRCPRCWYDLSYAPEPGMTCPECGYTAAHERQLHRTRRRYGHLMLALLVIVALAFYAQDRRGHRGWAATMPSHVLIAALPYVERFSPFYTELSERAAMGMLTESQWVALFRRCARGDSSARPPDPKWREKYGNMIWHTRRIATPPAAARSDDETVVVDYTDPEKHLLTIPPLVTARPSRELWPLNETAWASLTLVEWWPSRSEVRLKITPLADGLPSHTIRYTGGPPNIGSIAVPIGPVVEQGGAYEIPFEIEVFHRRGLRQDWRSVGSQRHALTVQAVDEEVTLLEPVGDENALLAAAVRRVFEGEVVRWSSGPSPVRFRYAPFAAWERGLEGIAIGAVIELRRDEALARRLEMWWLAGQANEIDAHEGMVAGGRQVRWDVVYEDLELLNELDESDKRWRLYIRGDRRLALRVPGADRYWAGELELPVVVAEGGETAPPPRVWVE